jgi:acetyltransferase
MESSGISGRQLDLANYVERWITHDGRTVILRPIKPQDKPIEKELIEDLSDESSRYRFFCTIKEATENTLSLFCDVDNVNAIAIIAEYKVNNRIRNVGVVRLLVDNNQQSGEFAILVADDFHNSGLGWKFMETLINIGRAKGLKSIYGTVLADNSRMLKLMKEFGFAIGQAEDGEVKVVHELQ